MPGLDEIAQQIRTKLDSTSEARDAAVVLSRDVIRVCANTIRAAHRGEHERAEQMLGEAAAAITRMKQRLDPFPEVYTAGYVHDCQKEYAEAALFLAVIEQRDWPPPQELDVEYPAYLCGMAEAVGEIRRHMLDLMRDGQLHRADALLDTMDEIYGALVTFDYPDGVTRGLRRITDSVRGIIEKTRGELTTALRQEELRGAIRDALAVLDGAGEPS